MHMEIPGNNLYFRIIPGKTWNYFRGAPENTWGFKKIYFNKLTHVIRN